MEPSSTALIVTCNIATTTKNYNILPHTTTDPIHTHTKRTKETNKKSTPKKHPSFIAVSISTHPNKSRILIMIRSITNKNSELLEPTNQIKRFIRLSHLDAFGDAIRTAAIRAG